MTLPISPDPEIVMPADDPDNESLVVVFENPNQPAGLVDVLVCSGDLCTTDTTLTCKDVLDGTVASNGPPSNNNDNSNDAYDSQSFSSESLIVYIDEPVPNQVPEPATLALFGMGLLGLGAIRRRMTKA